MNRHSRKLFSWTVISGLIFNLLSPLFLLPWQKVWACFGSWDCGGNAYCAGAGSYPDHPGSCADYGERGNNDRTTSEIAQDYINSGGNPAEVVTRTEDFQGALSNNNAAEAAAAAQQLATAEAQRIAAEQAAAAKAAADAAAAKAADDKAKAEAQRLAQEAAERAAQAEANAAAAATAMTAINPAVPAGTPAAGATTAPAVATPVAAEAACGSSAHNACSPNSDGNWYRCNNGSWQKADDCKPAGAITCAIPACAGANGCVGEGKSSPFAGGTEKVCSNGSWIDKSTVPAVKPQDPNPEEAMEIFMSTEDVASGIRGPSSPIVVNSPTARPITAAPTTAVAPPTSAPIPTAPAQQTDQEQVLEKFRCGERGGTWTNNTCQSPGRPSPTIVPSPTAAIRRPVNPTLIPAPPTPVPTVKQPDYPDESRFTGLKIPTPLPTNRPAGQAGLPGYRCSESGGELIGGECRTGVETKTEKVWAGGGTFGRTVKVTTKTFCSGNTAVTQTSRSDGTESSDSTVCEWGCSNGACRPPTIQETAVVRMDVINNAIDQAKVRCERSGKTNCDTAAVYQDAMQNVDAREPSQVQAAIISNTASQLSAGDKNALIEQEYQNLRSSILQAQAAGSGQGLSFGAVGLTAEDEAGLRQRAEENVNRILASGNVDAGGGNILDANSSDWDQIGGVSGDRAQEIIDQQKGIKGKFIAKAIFCSTNDEFQQQHLLDCGGLQLLDQDFLRSAWSGLIAGKSDDPIWTQGMKFGDARSAKYQVREYNDKVAPECGVYVAQRELTAEEYDCLTGQTVAALYKWDAVDEQNQVNAALNVTSAALGFAGGAVGAGIKATSLVGKAATVVLRSGVVSDLALVPAFAETMTAGDRAEANVLTALAEVDGISDDQRAMRQARAETAQAAADTAYTENVISSIVAVTAMNLGGEALGSVARRAIGDSPIGRLLLGDLPPAASQGAAREAAEALNNEVIAPASLFPGQVNRRVVSAEEVLAGINKVKTDLSGNTAEALANPGVVAGKNVPVGEATGDAVAAARTASRQNSGFIAEVKQGVGQIVSEGEIAITDVGRTLEKGVDVFVNNAAATARSFAQTTGEAIDAAKINLTGKGRVPVEVAMPEPKVPSVPLAQRVSNLADSVFPERVVNRNVDILISESGGKQPLYQSIVSQVGGEASFPDIGYARRSSQQGVLDFVEIQNTALNLNLSSEEIAVVARKLYDELRLEEGLGYLTKTQPAVVNGGGQVIDYKGQDAVGFEIPSSDNVDAIGIIADGHGSSREGKIAAQTARNRFTEFYLYHLSNGKDPKEAMRLAIADLDDMITREIGSRGDGGTTFTAGVQKGDQLYVGNVGDSRLYLIDGKTGKIRQITVDHNWPDGGYKYNILVSRSLGDNNIKVISRGEFNATPDIFGPFTVKKGDIVVMGSDSLEKLARKLGGEDQLQRTLVARATAMDPKSAAESLAQLAKNQGVSDDIGVVVMKVDSVGGKPLGTAEEILSQVKPPSLIERARNLFGRVE